MACFFLIRITVTVIVCMTVTLFLLSFVLNSLNYTFLIIHHLSIIKVVFRILFIRYYFSQFGVFKNKQAQTHKASLHHHPQTVNNMLVLTLHIGYFGQYTHPMEPVVHCLQTLPEDPYLSLRIKSIKHSLSLLTMCTWELSALML